MGDRELFWFGHIGEDFIKTIIPQIILIHNQDKLTEIALWIASEGGLSHCGIAFMDLIRAKKVNLTTIGLDNVNSTALLVWASGRVRKATRNCRFCFHKPTHKFCEPATEWVSADDYREAAIDLDIHNRKLCQLLAQRLNANIGDILRLGEEGACLSAQEMKKRKFLHQVI